MKKKIVFILTAIALCLAFVFSACGNSQDGHADRNASNGLAEPNAPDEHDGDGKDGAVTAENQGGDGETDILVAYFSATGTTKGVAEKIAEAAGGVLFEIVPQIPYTQADLNYGDRTTRATREQNDPASRPAIGKAVENIADYDVVFLGYPIWWSKAPKIIYTFLESYDFAGKTIVPFCTSGSSGIAGSLSDLKEIASGATWLAGERFSGDATKDAVQTWVDGLQS